MRKVYVIQEFDVGIEPTSEQFEEAINEAFQSIQKQHGQIIKTEYHCSHKGYLNTIIIEYETNEYKEAYK